MSLGDYEMVIGLEVHVQLKTATKMFCGCANEYGAQPNSRVCPVCSGMPGVLPVLNRRAVEIAMRAALALNCEIAPFTKFDRKNYYYPDLPKNYQISQYDLPISTHGFVEAPLDGGTIRVGITRAHLEEDAGKLIHPEIRLEREDGDGEGTGKSSGRRHDFSLVDLNRSGVPLLEIVSEPDMRTPEEATAYLTTLKQILQYIDVSDCDMEKGSLRCDANVSVRRKGAKTLGTKAEVKNVNSFKYVAKALAYEARRQIDLIESGGTVKQETLLFDQVNEVTRPMRSKEMAHDYRYFPEPDLTPVKIGRDWVEATRRALPELPHKRRARFVQELGLPAYDAGVLTDTRASADYFETCARLHGNAKTVSNWLMGELRKEMNERRLEFGTLTLAPAALVELIRMVETSKITRLVAKDVLAEMLATGKAAGAIVADKGLGQIDDAAELGRMVDEVIAGCPKIVDDYKGGKKSAVQSLIGQVMKATRGKANAQRVRELLERKLDAGA